MYILFEKKKKLLITLFPLGQIQVLKQRPWQFQRCIGPQIHRNPASTCCMKVSRSQFGGETNKAKVKISVLKEKLWETIPTSVKDLEWKKAVDILLHRLIFLAQKTLKWSIVIYFIFSSLSDFLFSVSRNQELMTPFGLLAGCLISNVLNETSQQVFSRSEEVCFILKIFSTSMNLCMFGFLTYETLFYMYISVILVASLDRRMSWTGTS